MPKVSVIIPSYNVAGFIEKCIDSVLDQSLNDIEIICIDAGSDDGTAGIIMNKAELDERVRFVHSNIKSYGYQVNLGLGLAAGEYVGILESDDYIAEKMYEILFNLAKDNEADLVKADYNRIIGLDDGEISIHISLFDDNKYYNKVIKPDGDKGNIIFSRDCNIWSGIYKREFLLKNHILCNETPKAAFQDIGFVLQTLCAADRVLYINVPLYQYRYLREGASTLNPDVLKFVYQETKYVLDNPLISENSRFPFVMKRLENIFMHEYGRMASQLGCELPCIKGYYEKLRDIYKDLKSDLQGFSLLMEKPQICAMLQKRIYQCNAKFEENLVEKYMGKDIVVIGYGKRGRSLKNLCDSLGLKVRAVGDNHPRGKAVSPEECVKLYPDAYYLIASKSYAEELYLQLLNLGITKRKIEVYRPMEKIICYGAGRIGSRCERFFARHNLEPICFLDVSSDKEGTFVGDVPVLKAADIIALGDNAWLNGAVFFISMASGTEQIKDQMVSAGIDNKKIYTYEDRQDLLSFIIERLVPYGMDDHKKTDTGWQDVFFDLGNGVVLGGVESWSVDMGNYLRSIGKNVYYVAPRYGTDIYRLHKKDVVGIVKNDDISMFEYCLEITRLFVDKDRFVYVCNFYNIILDLVVWLKRNWHRNIKIIAVVHNDMEGYYETYSNYVEDIDRIFYMSQRQKDILRNQYNLPEEKLFFLGWQIPCKKDLKRTWSNSKEPLKLGYAGRLEIMQKRADLLLALIMLLFPKGINVQFTIAGDGSYRESMEEELKRHGLAKKVNFMGQLPKEKMLSFWEKQDVMVSCSDWEGNSISKAEAMAAGAVPVVTDTSGALDDIDDGRNGYVVPVGEVEKIADVIEKLYRQREVLPVMGKAAHERILINNEKINLRKFWDDILV